MKSRRPQLVIAFAIVWTAACGAFGTTAPGSETETDASTGQPGAESGAGDSSTSLDGAIDGMTPIDAFAEGAASTDVKLEVSASPCTNPPSGSVDACGMTATCPSTCSCSCTGGSCQLSCTTGKCRIRGSGGAILCNGDAICFYEEPAKCDATGGGTCCKL